MKYFFFCLFIIKLSFANSQDLFNSITDTRNVYTLNAYDLSGNPIPTGNQAGIEGSKMLMDQFVKGIVKFKNGKIYRDVQLNLSLTGNEVYFKKDSITMAFFNPVDEFALTDNSNSNGKITYFKSGYPAVGTNTNKSFYQVLSKGSKICLLKYIYKTAKEHYEYGGPLKKEYVVKENYYFYDVLNNKMSEINLSTNSIKKSLSAYTVIVKQFLSLNKPNLKREENVISLIDFINQQSQS